MRRWLLLAGALVGLYALSQLASWSSPRLPGPAGEVYRCSRAGDIRAGALFYTEVEPVADYLLRADRR